MTRKLYIKEVGACVMCPYLDWGINCAHPEIVARDGKRRQILLGKAPIPHWCPLPDAELRGFYLQATEAVMDSLMIENTVLRRRYRETQIALRNLLDLCAPGCRLTAGDESAWRKTVEDARRVLNERVDVTNEST